MRSTGTLFCLASGAAFGAMAIFGKLAYEGGATVGTLLSVRFAIAAAALWLIVLATGGRQALRALTRRDVAAGLGLGVVGYALQSGTYFAALERMDASIACLVLYTFPAIVAVAAAGLGRDRLDAPRAAALVLTSAGLVLVVTGAGAGDLDAVGAVLALTAAAVYSAFILVSEGINRRLSPLTLSALICTGAAVSLGTGSALLGEWRPGELTGAGWGAITALALVSTVAAFALFFAGLRRVGPTTAAILATVEPLGTVVLAFVVFGETLTGVQAAGGALVLAAVVALNARLPRIVRDLRVQVRLKEARCLTIKSSTRAAASS